MPSEPERKNRPTERQRERALAMQPAVQSSAPRAGKNVYIQGARGLFAFFVVLYHVHNSGLATVPALRTGVARFLLGSLEHGVELFFGISGIVIIASLLRHQSASRFMHDRLTRLLPVLWVSNCLILAFATFVKVPLPPLHEVVASFLLPPPFLNIALVNPIAWTLGFEFCFYVFCAVWWLCWRRSSIALVLLAMLAAVWLFVYPRTMMMLMGVVIAFGWLDNSVTRKLSRHALFWLICYLVCLRAVVQYFGDGSVDAANPLLLNRDQILPFELALWLTTTTGGLALMGIASGSGILGRFLGSAPMVKLGDMSFSLYLWHIPVMALVKRIILALGFDGEIYSQLLMLVVSVPLSLLVARFSYELIELRLTRWLRSTQWRPRPSLS